MRRGGNWEGDDDGESRGLLSAGKGSSALRGAARGGRGGGGGLQLRDPAEPSPAGQRGAGGAGGGLSGPALPTARWHRPRRLEKPRSRLARRSRLRGTGCAPEPSAVLGPEGPAARPGSIPNREGTRSPNRSSTGRNPQPAPVLNREAPASRSPLRS